MADLKMLDTGIPELREKLDFADFHPALEGNSVDVWLNLSEEFQDEIRAYREMWAGYRERQAEIQEKLEGDQTSAEEAEGLRQELRERVEKAGEQTASIYSRLWDCTVEEYHAVMEKMDDPLQSWVLTQTWEMIGDYREGRKNGRTSSSRG